jgi:hypothetical protein
MNTFTPGATARYVRMILLAVVVLATSCAKKMTFQQSTVVPTAEGRVKIKKDDNGNYAINLKVTHLAPPDRLTPPKKVYIAWLVTENERARNIGQLRSTKGFFTRKYNASLDAVSVYKPIRIFITAEDDATPTFPGSPTVLTAQ